MSRSSASSSASREERASLRWNYTQVPQNQEQDPDFIVERKLSMEYIRTVMEKKLNKREYQIISLRYGIGGQKSYTQREVAIKLGISRSYISRLESKAIAIIQQHRDICNSFLLFF